MTKPLDAPSRHWTDALPPNVLPYAQLARLDRPVGWLLLALPCLMGIGVARNVSGYFFPEDLILAVLFVVGAVAMRGAGCTWNDIVDRDIDAKVARTRLRPLPSGRIALRQAYGWLGAQLALGFVVWLALPGPKLGEFPVNLAQITALGALPLVAIYPLMKRITWWPQVWLGLVFSWGVLVAGAAINQAMTPEIILLYAGCVVWTIGYDTIYALQDKDDDALIGVRSTARLFGSQWRAFVIGFYCVALFFWSAALYVATETGAPVFWLVALTCFAIMPTLYAIKDEDAVSALRAFKRNVPIGAAVAALCNVTPGFVTFQAVFSQ